MDEALRKRLDAVLALLAVIAALLAGVLVAVGGARVLALLVLVGFTFGTAGWSMWATYGDRETRPDSADETRGGR